MIITKDSTIRIDSLSHLEALEESHIAKLRLCDMNGEIFFRVHPLLITNQEKSVYKSGFLAEFLKTIYPYPEKTFDQICEILNTRYDVFLSRRQIERNLKKFKETPFFQ